MLGVTLAPVTGLMMAELIASGHQDPDLHPFDPGRFVE
jgi:glycine/D-amino acid oxidase-like deaminating enzyme